MKNKRKLAGKVMEYLNENTRWKFQILKRFNSYNVKTSFENEKGQIIEICFALKENIVQLEVVVYGCDCTDDFVQGKIHEAKLGFHLFAKELDEKTVGVGTQMSLEDLETGMYDIAYKRMVSMVQVLNEVLNDSANKNFRDMKNRRKLAYKVKECVDAFTGWKFHIWTNGESYSVVTLVCNNNRGKEVVINYMILEEGAQLQLIADRCKFDTGFVQEKIKEAKLDFPVFAKEMEEAYAIETPMSLEELDNRLHSIVREKMTAMLQIMGDIIHEKVK